MQTPKIRMIQLGLYSGKFIIKTLLAAENKEVW